MNHACQWRAVAPEAIAFREWDEELVVYNDATGHTHHLAPFGGKVLLALLHEPTGLDIPELIESVAATVQISETKVLAPIIEEALQELARLELIVCDPD
jgi:PqqD family protein of HPr-rel-A system